MDQRLMLSAIQSRYKSIGLILLSLIVLSIGLGTIGIVGGETGSDVSIISPDTVSPDDSFELIIDTNASAGTIVEINPESGDVVLSSEDDDRVKTIDNRVEFIDPDLGDSQYKISVDYNGGTSGDTIEVSSWVNAGTQSEADATDTKTITVQESVSITNATVVPETVDSTQEYNITFDITDVSADDSPDNITVKFPNTVKIESEPKININGNSLPQEYIKKQENIVNFSVNQSNGAPTDVKVKIKAIMTPNN